MVIGARDTGKTPHPLKNKSRLRDESQNAIQSQRGGPNVEYQDATNSGASIKFIYAGFVIIERARGSWVSGETGVSRVMGWSHETIGQAQEPCGLCRPAADGVRDYGAQPGRTVGETLKRSRSKRGSAIQGFDGGGPSGRMYRSFIEARSNPAS